MDKSNVVGWLGAFVFFQPTLGFIHAISLYECGWLLVDSVSQHQRGDSSLDADVPST